MLKLTSGIWIYLLIVGILVMLGFFLVFRKNNPASNFETLTNIQSKFALLARSPCYNSLSGEPYIPKGDNYLKINITCPDNTHSTNIFRFSAIPSSHNLYDTLSLLSRVNNIDIQYDSKMQIIAIGDIQNTGDKQWRIEINSASVSTNLDQVHLIPNNVVEIKYE
jgi:hypothetical protein